MSALEELDVLLRSLQDLKPPGVTKTKIESITSLCIQNVQDESLIIQKIFSQFKQSPTTHKLGVLYVVDSVTRQWVEKARQNGQDLAAASNTPAGTYAAGVHRMSEVLPMMMNETIQVAPENQKDKIVKLIDIWERGRTFPLENLSQFKQKLNSPAANVRSYTPPGSPPAAAVARLGLTPQKAQTQPQPAAAPSAPASSDAGAILAALANLNKPAASTAPSNNFPTQGNQGSVPTQPYAQQQTVAPFINPAPAMPAYAAPVSQPAAGLYGMPMAPVPQYAATPAYPTQTAPQVPQPVPGGNEMLMQLLQALPHLPPDQAAQVLAVLPQLMGNAQASVVPPPASTTTVGSVPPLQNNQANSNQSNQARDQNLQNGQNGAHDFNNQRHPRDRSRSPDFKGRGASPPRRRDSPTYGVYDPNAAQANNSSRGAEQDRRGRGKGRGGRNEYRQRTPPPAQNRPHSPARNMQPKYIDYDRTLPPGHIRVLSRTLFIGGATATEAELRNIFSAFGKVQSCIVNNDKRHAFVKMVNRNDAVAARTGMENMQDPDVLSKARSTRWGVGFGPRDCSDYQTGISVIPIDRLTDADRKWVLTAEYGGTGGKTIEPGMVIEEPDIEIGAGVSSKAISRRMPPEAGSHRGGRGNFGGRGGFDHGHQGHQRFRKQEARHKSPRAEANTIGVPPPVPGFGFQLPGMM